MRIRTLTALVTGAAMGAGGSYLLDPEHGRDRRRQALRAAWDAGRQLDLSDVTERATQVVGEVGRRALDGYRDAAAPVPVVSDRGRR